MKAMVCEMCGGNDLIKENGVYVCQNCGTKYSIEEAKKLMITIDDTDKVENLYIIARQAIEQGNNENAAKYYDMIYMSRPNDWEAAFYSVYCSAMQTNIAGISNAAAKIAMCLPNVMKLIRDNLENYSDQKAAIDAITKKVLSAGVTMISSQVNHMQKYKEVEGTADEGIAVAADVASMMLACGDVIEAAFPNNQELITEYACSCWEAGNGFSKDASKIAKYNSKIQQYNPNYAPEPIQSGSSGGCYVATCVYGSYDCPEVWTLRRFRDDTLAATWYGRMFVRLYYAVSPTIVKVFGKTEWFKKLWKLYLDQMVRKLWEEGVQDTPYKDRNW